MKPAPSVFRTCRSGSVSGLTLKLIRISVSKMLETLSDDDYVNVVYVSTPPPPLASLASLLAANVGAVVSYVRAFQR